MRPVVLLALCWLLSGALALSPSAYENCAVLDINTGSRFYWDAPTDGHVMRMAMLSRSSGWIGLGFGLSETMTNGRYGNDVAVGWVTAQGPCKDGCLFDMFIDTYSKPVRDDMLTKDGVKGTLDVKLVNASEADGYTLIEFTKNLTSGDPFDVNSSWFALDKEVYVIFAANELTDPFSEDGTWLQKHTTHAAIPIILADKGYVCSDEKPKENSYESPNKMFSVDWMVVNGGRDIQVTMEARTVGWLALGFSEMPKMKGADMIVGWVDNEKQRITLIDALALANERPFEDTALPDGHNDVLLLSGREFHGRTQITFRRKLVTGDPNDLELSDHELYMMWAFGASDGSFDVDGRALYDKHTQQGYAKVNFVRGQARDMGAAMAMHAALMIAAFLGLMPLGMFIARYLKRTFVHWFRMHLVLIVTALAMALISIILIVDAVSLSSLARGYHQIFALLAIVVTVLVQPLLGIMSDYKWRQAMRRVQESETPSTPWTSTLWDKAHWWLARLAMLLLLVTIGLGISAYGRNSTALYLALAFLVVLYVAAIVLQERMGGQVTHAPGQHLKSDDDDKTPTILTFERNSFLFSCLAFIGAVVVAMMMSLLLAPLVTTTISNSHSVSVAQENDVLTNCRDCFDLTFRFPNYTVPAPETSYICQNFYFPVDKDYHIVKIEPLIDDPSLVHHISLFAIDRPFPQEFFECTLLEHAYYPYYIWFWGVGMPPFVYPADTGFKIGKRGVQFAVMQIHYNNGLYLSNLMDSSGVRITLTPTLRKHDVSTLRVGARLGQINIPPGEEKHVVVGNCTARFTRYIMDHDITIFAFSFHMHTLATNAFTQHFRGDQLLGEAGREDFYHFDAQRWNDIDRFVFKVGDSFVTRCFFDSRNRKRVTKGGFRAVEEMCWNTFMYYPPLNIKIWEGQGLCLE